MADDDHDNRWLAHRREGWTVETDHHHEPVSVHETFDDAREALGSTEGADGDVDRAGGR